MTDEHMSEFDYALDWFRRIVAHSESTMEELMYQITPEAITRLSETSQQLFGKLQTSVFWPLVKDEPVIREFMDALSAIESQVRQQQAPPDSPAMYGTGEK
jgi:hypothetical protein